MYTRCLGIRYEVDVVLRAAVLGGLRLKSFY